MGRLSSMLVGLIASLVSGAGAGAQPVSRAPSEAHSAEKCLSVAADYLAWDHYRDAVTWLEAARERATDEAVRDAAADALRRARLLGRQAPRLAVDRWLTKAAPPRDLWLGKVVVVDFFAVPCMGCPHAHARLKEWREKYRDRGLEVVSLVVGQSAEGIDETSPIVRYLATRPIEHPVGIDKRGGAMHASFGGEPLPATAVIDRTGRVRWTGSFDDRAVLREVLKLLAEAPGEALPGLHPDMPLSRGAEDVVGERAPAMRLDRWFNPRADKPAAWRGRPRLVRFLMDGCPFCTATMPALNAIHDDYEDDGLVVVGIYHPKPRPRTVSDAQAAAAVDRLGPDFPLAVDADWAYLRRIWLDGGERSYTSVSFLIDHRGIIRYVHPGPAFYPSEVPNRRQENQDYQALRRAIEIVLEEYAAVRHAGGT